MYMSPHLRKNRRQRQHSERTFNFYNNISILLPINYHYIPISVGIGHIGCPIGRIQVYMSNSNRAHIQYCLSHD